MFRITQCLSAGPFADAGRVPLLLAGGVTHVLNVSDGPSHASAADGFAGVGWVPMSDMYQLPWAVARSALDALHEFASAAGAHVYVHCAAGIVRGPTILWLYLIALGVPPADARRWIEASSPLATPGAARMVTADHVRAAQAHGRERFLPLTRPELIVPLPLAGAE